MALLEDVFGYARRRVADRVTAEDLTVAALLAAGCGTGQRVDRAGAFRALARALAELPGALADDPDGPAMALFAQALEPALLDGFERLDLERRRVLTLHYLDRLAPAEMAAVLGTRAAAVQSRLAAALRALERAGDASRARAGRGGPTAPTRPSVPPELSAHRGARATSPELSGPADLEARLAEAAARARATRAVGGTLSPRAARDLRARLLAAASADPATPRTSRPP